MIIKLASELETDNTKKMTFFLKFQKLDCEINFSVQISFIKNKSRK